MSSDTITELEEKLELIDKVVEGITASPSRIKLIERVHHYQPTHPFITFRFLTMMCGFTLLLLVPTLLAVPFFSAEATSTIAEIEALSGLAPLPAFVLGISIALWMASFLASLAIAQVGESLEVSPQEKDQLKEYKDRKHRILSTIDLMQRGKK